MISVAFLLLVFNSVSSDSSSDDAASDDSLNYYIRRCSGNNEQTTCGNRFVGRNGDIEISTFDTAFDFDNENVCINVNGVATSEVEIKLDENQGPESNIYNTIQANLNCFGGFRGMLSSFKLIFILYMHITYNKGYNNARMIILFGFQENSVIIQMKLMDQD